MAKTTIRVELPTSSPDLLVALLETLLTEHDKREAETPGSSPLKAEDIVKLRPIVTGAKADRLKAKNLTAQAAALTEESNKALGLAAGQNQRVENTGLYYAAQLRDSLLVTYRGRENAMEPFGYKVVLGSAAAPKRKPKA